MLPMLEKILANRESRKWAILYGEIYKKPTGFHSVEEILADIEETSSTDLLLCQLFKEKFPNINLEYKLQKLELLKFSYKNEAENI